MKIKYIKPPNYDEIIKQFPSVKDNHNVVFTYGDTLFVPYPMGAIPPDLMAHEETHSLQQADVGVEQWWKNYFKMPQFRLSQEVEAYQAQMEALKETHNRHGRRAMLDKLSTDLSSSIYGDLVSKQEAKDLIKGDWKLRKFER